MGQTIKSSARSLHAIRDAYGQSVRNSVASGVDLTKIWGTQNTGEKMVINDESIGVSQLLGARTRAVPQSLRPCLLPWLSKLHFCLCRVVARIAFGVWTSGAFLLILGEFLGTFRLI